MYQPRNASIRSEFMTARVQGLSSILFVKDNLAIASSGTSTSVGDGVSHSRLKEVMVGSVLY